MGALAGAALAPAVGWSVRRHTGADASRVAAMFASAGLCGAAAACASGWAGAVAGVALTAALLALALIDLAVLRLPDALTLPLAALGLAWSAAYGVGWAEAVLGAALGFGALVTLAAGYRRSRGREGLGRGDAKLLAAGGAWLGWAALPGVVLTACALAFVWAGFRLVRRGRPSLAEPLPFGPPLAAGVWLVFLLAARTGAGRAG